MEQELRSREPPKRNQEPTVAQAAAKEQSLAAAGTRRSSRMAAQQPASSEASQVLCSCPSFEAVSCTWHGVWADSMCSSH